MEYENADAVEMQRYMQARITKVLSEGVQLWRFLFCYILFLSWWGEGGSKYHYKRAIIGLPAKRH